MKLSIQNLSVRRGARPVINMLSFDVEAGEALLVKGTNGSGKTTLLRTLAGFLTPEAGRIELENFESDEVRLSEVCHYVGHLNAIKASQTVDETLSFYAGFLNPEADRNDISTCVDQALDRFSLSGLASIPSGYLSAGQKRRLGLARTLCAPRPIWLLDEPTTSLDQKNAGALSEIITDHVASGGLVIAATHLDLGLDNARVLQLDEQARTT